MTDPIIDEEIKYHRRNKRDKQYQELLATRDKAEPAPEGKFQGKKVTNVTSDPSPSKGIFHKKMTH